VRGFSSVLLVWVWIWVCVGVCPWPSLCQSAPDDLSDATETAVEDRAFVELLVPRSTYFVHEPIRLRLRIGVDVRFFCDQVIQPFRRRLDVPVHVQASWFENLTGTLPHEEGAAMPAPPTGQSAGGERLSFVLNDTVVEAVHLADRLVEERTFTVLEIERSYLPIRAGKLVIPAPALRFAYATRFRDDLINGRVPKDRFDAMVRGRTLELLIRPLPVEGRPAEFTGAVGDFVVNAEADRHDLDVGESFRLIVRIEGRGDLKSFGPPRLSGFERFHIFGRIEKKRRAHRTFIYDLAPLGADVTEVPSIRFAFFDPGPSAGYHTVQTEAIPLAVRAPPGGARLAAGPGDGIVPIVPGENDIFGPKPIAVAGAASSRLHGDAARALNPAALIAGIIAPWLAAVGLLYWLHAREKRRGDPDGARARGAAAAFRASVRRRHVKLAQVFAEYLAARLCRSAAAAVIVPDLAARLEAAGLPADPAERAAALLDELVAARYGGPALAESRDLNAARALVDELEPLFRTIDDERKEQTP